MTPPAANVFCASTLFHLLTLQSLARERLEAGERNLIVLTRPMLRESEQHLKGFEPYRRLLFEELWAGVLADERVARDYDLRAAGVGGSALAALRAARAQRRLDRFLGGAAPLRAAYVCNPLTGAVDRHVASWARQRGGAVVFVEDGTGSYLPPRLKHSIDRSYWTRPANGSARVERGAELLLGLDRKALEPPPPFDSDLAYDATQALFPDRFPASPLSGEILPLSHRRLRSTIEALRDRVEDRSAAAAADDETAVYLSRPDSEDGLLAAEDEVELVSRALAELSRSARVILKPHPRDGRSKIAEIASRGGVEVVDPDPHPAELYLDRHRPASCYGTWSGSLVYARELLGIPGRSLLPGFCESLRRMGRPSPQLEAIGDAFAPLFPELFGDAAGPTGAAR